MVKVIQIIATNAEDKYFESQLIDGNWHAFIYYPELRTVCGIQLQGEDGYAGGETKNGKVTCRVCIGVIEAIKTKY